MIPTAVVAPILRKLIEQEAGEEVGSDWAGRSEPDNGQYSPIKSLAFRAGVHQDTVSIILTEGREHASLNTVDKLLSALEAPQLWQVEPLRSYYYAENLARQDYERRAA